MPHSFHPAVAAWFAGQFPAPTPAQARAWPLIRAQRNVLIAAPTGSGKTLAAFLAAIDALVVEGLATGLADETAVVYVSPLKALSNDVRKNLEIPLAGIRSELAARGLADVDIRTLVRTGDTPQHERASMRRRPPHIVVTTPESLYVLLGSESGRTMLATTRTVIVDEIHALASNKRGSHLALSLARLEGARRSAARAHRPLGDAKADRRDRALPCRNHDAVDANDPRIRPRPGAALRTVRDHRHRPCAAAGSRAGGPRVAARGGDVERGVAAGIRAARRPRRAASNDARVRQHAADGGARDAAPVRAARCGARDGAPRQPGEGAPARPPSSG